MDRKGERKRKGTRETEERRKGRGDEKKTGGREKLREHDRNGNKDWETGEGEGGTDNEQEGKRGREGEVEERRDD